MKKLLGLILVLTLISVLCAKHVMAADASNSAYLKTNAVRITKIVDQKRISEIQEDFKIGSRKRGFSVHSVSCGQTIEYWQNIGGHDHSYGAICTTGDNDVFMMCNDILIGKFSLRKVKNATQDDLVRFIAKYCPPGG